MLIEPALVGEFLLKASVAGERELAAAIASGPAPMLNMASLVA